MEDYTTAPPPLPDEPPPLPAQGDREWMGALYLFMGHLILGAVTGGAAFLTFGVSQLLYGIPLLIWTTKKSLPRTRRGAVIGMIVSFLINGGCFATVMWNLGKGGY